jgi:hypothetical protein
MTTTQQITSVLSKYIQGHPSYRTEAGVLRGDWVADCSANSQSARDIIAQMGNWTAVDLELDAAGNYRVWVEGPCRGHWLTWEDLDDLETWINQR